MAMLSAGLGEKRITWTQADYTEYREKSKTDLFGRLELVGQITALAERLGYLLFGQISNTCTSSRYPASTA